MAAADIIIVADPALLHAPGEPSSAVLKELYADTQNAQDGVPTFTYEAPFANVHPGVVATFAILALLVGVAVFLLADHGWFVG